MSTRAPVEVENFFKYTVSSVSSVLGFNTFEDKWVALRRLVENKTNEAYRLKLLEISKEFSSLPNLLRAERNASKHICSLPDVKNFASKVEVTVSDIEKERDMISGIATSTFESAIASPPIKVSSDAASTTTGPSGIDLLDMKQVTSDYSKIAIRSHEMLRGNTFERNAFDAIKSKGIKTRQVVNMKETTNAHFTVGEDPSTCLPDSTIVGRLGYMIVGRVDGWEELEDGGRAIVEVKTRQKGLLSWPWEIYQLVTYMVINACSRARKVQYFNGEAYPDEIIYLKDYVDHWKVVKDGLNDLTRRLFDALKSKEDAEELLRQLYPLKG